MELRLASGVLVGFEERENSRNAMPGNLHPSGTLLKYSPTVGNVLVEMENKQYGHTASFRVRNLSPFGFPHSLFPRTHSRRYNSDLGSFQ